MAIVSQLFFIWHSGNPLEKICELYHNSIRALRPQTQVDARERKVIKKEEITCDEKNAIFVNSKALIQDYLILSVLRQRDVNASFTASWTVAMKQAPATFIWEKALWEAWSEQIIPCWCTARRRPPADWQFMDREDKSDLPRSP